MWPVGAGLSRARAPHPALLAHAFPDPGLCTGCRMAQRMLPILTPISAVAAALPPSACRALSLCPVAHPKDAEQLVAQACQEGGIQPNATTARTLEKLWAVHEQLYG